MVIKSRRPGRPSVISLNCRPLACAVKKRGEIYADERRRDFFTGQTLRTAVVLFRLFSGVGGVYSCIAIVVWPYCGPSRLHNAGKECVGFSPIRQTLLAPSAKRREVFGKSHDR